MKLKNSALSSIATELATYIAYQWEKGPPSLDHSTIFIINLIENFKPANVYEFQNSNELQSVNMKDLDFDDQLQIVTTSMQILAAKQLGAQNYKYLTTSDNIELNKERMSPIYNQVTLFLLKQHIAKKENPLEKKRNR
ncbi:hypothetical protein [Legionella busanensis]|nr:hypothetical protein [Legionella busanensis]